MKKIAHRGNTKGRNFSLENQPEYLLAAAASYYVEVDVWYQNEKFYTGHDLPTHPVDLNFLKNPVFFCHAKNEAALQQMMMNDVHCFWHQDDKMTLTSKGYVWKYPEVYFDGELWGVCSDWL